VDVCDDGLTMKRRVLFGLAGLVVIAGRGLVALEYWFSPVPGATPKNFRRLRYDMSKAQVLAILGEPTTTKRGHKVFAYMWRSEACVIHILLLDDNELAEGQLAVPGPHGDLAFATTVCDDDPGLWERVREWLGL
jgi:hypothetical protein